ncbi:hypothetical protein C8R45DRAFT_1091388 [Mycena sanguinolenta]|nr:hypothetical protein C8R45DRAFT_1091388 [Mycena sanguinolenta]
MPPLSALDIVRLWIFGRRFFASPQFSPPFRLDWDQQDAWGDLVAFDWGVLNPTAPRCFYHERSTTASVMLCIGYEGVYPSEWTMEEIAHQHFLAYAVLSFWHIEVHGPPGWPIHLCWLHRAGYTTPTDAMDSLLDRMTLKFETRMKNWKRAGKAERNNHDERHKRELVEARDELLLFLLTMERVLLWLNRLGVWVAWSENYNLQMMHLYPDAFDSFPIAEQIANSSGLLLREVEPTTPGYILEGEELDILLHESGLEPANFLNATLPLPPTPSPLLPPRDPTPPPITVLEEDFAPSLHSS